MACLEQLAGERETWEHDFGLQITIWTRLVGQGRLNCDQSRDFGHNAQLHIWKEQYTEY